jgi:hypothetical protein
MHCGDLVNAVAHQRNAILKPDVHSAFFKFAINPDNTAT